jgi:hypothetical protein
MCTAGQLTGILHGSYGFTMAQAMPSGDPTIPGVTFYTGLSEMGTWMGDLVGTDAGAIDLNPAGTGKFSTLITITDGMGNLAGATGYLQIRGTLDFATGGAKGDYVGQVCVGGQH